MVERLNGIQEVRSSILLGSTYKFENWNRSSVWLERLPVTQEVASSSLVGSAGKASKLLLAFFVCSILLETIKHFYNSTDEYSHSDLAKIPESLRDIPLQDFYLPPAQETVGR